MIPDAPALLATGYRFQFVADRIWRRVSGVGRFGNARVLVIKRNRRFYGQFLRFHVLGERRAHVHHSVHRATGFFGEFDVRRGFRFRLFVGPIVFVV